MEQQITFSSGPLSRMSMTSESGDENNVEPVIIEHEIPVENPQELLKTISDLKDEISILKTRIERNRHLCDRSIMQLTNMKRDYKELLSRVEDFIG